MARKTLTRKQQDVVVEDDRVVEVTLKITFSEDCRRIHVGDITQAAAAAGRTMQTVLENKPNPYEIFGVDVDTVYYRLVSKDYQYV